jgi:hypothetical protein
MQGAIRGGQNLEFVDTGPSRRLWAECPWDDIGGTVRGVKFYEDFSGYPSWATLTNPTIAAASAINPFKHATYFDTADTIKQSASQPMGALEMVSAATDNNEAWQQPGGGAGGGFSFVAPATATPYDVWYEIRFKLLAVTANVSSSVFLGFGEEGMAVANTKVDDTMAMADKDFIGFNSLTASISTLSFTYKKNGTTVQVPLTAATLVADTFVTVGFHYRYAANPSARKICVFRNNVLNATGVTAAAIAASTFPDSEEMSPLWGHKNSSAAAATLTIAWIKAAMAQN